MAESIGYATLQIIPSMKGIQQGITSQIAGPLKASGAKAGKDMGDAIASGLEQAKGKVEKASATLAKARDKEADAAGKVRVAEKQLEDLRANSRAKASQIVAAEEKIAKAKRDTAAAAKAASDAEKQHSTAKTDFAALGKSGGKDMGGGLMDGVSGAVSKLGGKAGPIGMALTAIVGVGIGVGGALMGAITDGMKQETRQDLIQAQLGVNEETAAKLGDAAGKAYVGNFGDSVAGNMDAAKAALQTGLLSGEEDTTGTQAMIEKLQTVSQLMGEDIPTVARSAGQAIKTGIATDGAGALDLITASTQKGLNVNEDLLDTLNEYGTQFRKLGLSGPEAMGLVSQAVKGGARDTDVAADAIKEFSIRAVDGSKSTQDGFEQLNLNAQEMGETFAKGGTGAHDALGKVFDSLRNVKDEQKRGQIAAELFGTQWEDLGGAFDKFDLSNATKQLGDVAGATDRASKIIGDNPAAAMETAKRAIEQSSNQIKGSLAEAFGPAIGKIAEWVSTHKPEILDFFKQVGDAAFEFMDATFAVSEGVLRAFAPLADNMGKVLGTITSLLGGFISGVGEVFSVIPGMGDVGDKMKSIGDKTQDFGDKMRTLGDVVRNDADGVGKMRDGLSGLRTSFDNAAGGAVEAEKVTRMFGGTVQELPDSKDVKVNALTDEAKALVDKFHLQVTTLPDGHSVIHADTQTGQDEIDSWVRRDDGHSIDMYVNLLTAPGGSQQAPATIDSLLNPAGRASGGRISGPGSGTSDSIPAMLSNGEFVVNAAAARKNMSLLTFINAKGFAAGGMASATSEEDQVADAIIAEGQRRGISEKGIKIALAVGLAESGLHNLNYGDQTSTGVFQQQDNGAWGTAADRMDPTKSAGMFYTELAKQDYNNMAPQVAAQAVQRSGFPDGSNYSAQLGAADAIYNARAAAGVGQPASGVGGDTTGAGGTPGDASTQFIAPGVTAQAQQDFAKQKQDDATADQADWDKSYTDAQAKWGENWGKAGNAALMGQFAGTPFENAANKGQTIVNFVQKDLTEAFDKWKRHQATQAAAAASRL